MCIVRGDRREGTRKPQPRPGPAPAPRKRAAARIGPGPARGACPRAGCGNGVRRVPPNPPGLVGALPCSCRSPWRPAASGLLRQRGRTPGRAARGLGSRAPPRPEGRALARPRGREGVGPPGSARAATQCGGGGRGRGARGRGGWWRGGGARGWGVPALRRRLPRGAAYRQAQPRGLPGRRRVEPPGLRFVARPGRF